MNEYTNDKWDEISYIISSNYRTAVLGRLADGPGTPSQISGDTDLATSHVSRALQDLRQEELVDLLVSEERRKGRVYGITDRGEEVWSKMLAENLV